MAMNIKDLLSISHILIDIAHGTTIQIRKHLLNDVTTCIQVIAPRGALQPSMGEILWRYVVMFVDIKSAKNNIAAKNNSAEYEGDLVTFVTNE